MGDNWIYANRFFKTLLGLGKARLDVTKLGLNFSNVFLNRAFQFKFFVAYSGANGLFDFAHSLVGMSFDLIFVDAHDEPLVKLIDAMSTCDKSHTSAD